MQTTGYRTWPIGLEGDLPATLRDSIKHLEPDLDIVDGRTERSVASGFIDIAALASDGFVAFEDGVIPSIANACSLIGECDVGRLTHLKQLPDYAQFSSGLRHDGPLASWERGLPARGKLTKAALRAPFAGWKPAIPGRPRPW